MSSRPLGPMLDRDVPVDVVALTYFLRANGLRVSLEQCLDAQQLLNDFAGELAETLDDQQLAAVLGPILTTSLDEAERFRDLFAQYRAPPRMPEPVREGSPGPVRRLPPPTRSRWIMLVVAACTLLVWAGALMLPVVPVVRPQKSPDQGTNAGDPPVTPPVKPPEPTPAPEPTPSSNAGRIVELTLVRTVPAVRRNPWIWWWLVGLPPVIGAAGFWLRSRTRPVTQVGESSVPHEALAKAFPRLSPDLQVTLGVRRAATRLRQRHRVAGGPIDMAQTVHATALKGGDPTPVYSSQVDVRYLAFVQRQHQRDQQAILALQLLQDLVEHGVPVESYWFDETPERAFLEQGRRQIPASLSSLLDQYPEHALLVVGDGSEFFDRVTGILAAWVPSISGRKVVLLTTIPVDQWTRREWQLEMRLGIAVVPLSSAGLHDLQAAFAGRRPSSMSPQSATRQPPLYRAAASMTAPAEDIQARIVEDLKQQLTPAGLEWLCALAVYPGFHWSITCTLGKALLGDRFRELLPRLVQLPWLRRGQLPEWLRDRLIAELSPQKEQQVRQELLQLLASVESRPPGSPQEPPDPLEILRARGGVYNEQLRDPLNDDVFLEFLTNLRGSRQQMRMPIGFWRQLAPRGVWLAGLKTRAAAAVMLSAAVLWAGFVSTWWPEPTAIDLALSEDGTHILQRFTDGSVHTTRTTLMRPGKISRQIGENETVQLLPGAELLLIQKTNGKSSTLEIVDRKTGAVRTTLEPTLASIQGIVPTPDGQDYVSAAGGGNIYVWNVKSGKQRLRLESGGQLNAESLAITPDGRRLYVTAQPRGLLCWNLETGEFISTPAASINSQTCVVATPDNRSIVTGATDGKLRIWDRRTGQLSKTLSAHTEAIVSLAVTADNLLIAGDVTGVIYLWSMAAGTFQRLEGHRAAVIALVLTPDGQQLMTGGDDGMVRIWDLPSGRLLQTLQEYPAVDMVGWGIRLATDGRQLIIIVGDTEVQVHDLEPASAPETSVAALPGQLLATSGDGREMLVKEPASGLTLRDPNGRILQRFPGAEGGLFATDLNRLITWQDRFVQAWGRSGNASNYTDEQPFSELPAPVEQVVMLGAELRREPQPIAHRGLLVAKTRDGVLHIASPDLPNDPESRWEANEYQSDGVLASPDLRTSYWWFPDGKRVMHQGFAPALRTWNLSGLTRVKGRPTNVVLAPDGSQVLEWNAEGELTRIEPGDDDQLVASPVQHIGKPVSAGFSRFGLTHYILDEAGQLHFFDRAGALPPAALNGVASVAHRPGRDDLAVVFQDGSLQLWSLWSARPISDRLQTASPIRRATMQATLTSDPNFDLLVTEHADGSLSDWHLEARGKLQVSVPDPVTIPAGAAPIETENSAKQALPDPPSGPIGIDLTSLFDAEIDHVETMDELIGSLSDLPARNFLIVNAIGWAVGDAEWNRLAAALKTSPVTRVLIITDRVLPQLDNWDEQSTRHAAETLVKTRTVIQVPAISALIGSGAKSATPSKSPAPPSGRLPLQTLMDVVMSQHYPCDGLFVAQKMQERLRAKHPGTMLSVAYKTWPAAGHTGGDVYFPEARVSVPVPPEDDDPRGPVMLPKQLLHKLGLALQNYWALQKNRPKDWRTELQPYLEQGQLDKPTDPPKPVPGFSRIVAVRGPGTAWDTRSSVDDGTTNGVLMIALGRDHVLGEMSVDEALAAIMKPVGEAPTQALFSDGSVRALAPTIDKTILRELLSPHGFPAATAP